MGTLRDLKSNEKNVHLLVTNSNLVELYVYDSLKEYCKATLESVYEINKRSEFQEMLEFINMQPYMADKWLFVVDYSKLKAIIKQYVRIFDIDTSCFLVKCKNYAEFKEFKELYPKVNDLYLSIIRSPEVTYLLQDFKLSQKLVEFITKSYSREPEKIFTLLKELKNGVEIKDSKDIVKICGVSSSSVVSFAMLLLADPPKSDTGEKRVLKKRIQIANDLISAYGLSSFRNFLVSSVKDMIDIKTLYLKGVIYKSIRYIPECYDEKKLSRYNVYLRRITEEISMDRLVRLYICLKKSGKWYNKSMMLQFIYDYYGGYCDEVVSKL